MPFINNKSGILNTVVISVCTGEEIAEQLLRAVEKKPWSVNFSSFSAYISSARRPSFAPQMKAATACIAFVDFDQDLDMAIETSLYLTQTFADKAIVIAVAEKHDPATILKAMRAGCSEFLHKPLISCELAELLDRLEKTWSNTVERSMQSGSVISLFGAKGGVGTTTLAVHMALYLTQRHKKRILLIDHHPELGHVCVYLGMDGSRYHFHEVVRNVGRLDSELLHGFVAKHSSGLDVLSSPDVYGGMKPMDPDSIAKTLEFLRSEYDYVIIDCSLSLEEIHFPVIDASTQIYLVATPEVGAIRDLSRYVDKLMLLDRASEKIQVAINRSSSPYAIHIEQIEKAMKLPIAIRIPNSYPELVRSGNLGEPISSTTNSEFASQILHWVDALVGATKRDKPVKKAKSLFAVWKHD